jgi:hypothetical protein
MAWEKRSGEGEGGRWGKRTTNDLMNHAIRCHLSTRCHHDESEFERLGRILSTVPLNHAHTPEFMVCALLKYSLVSVCPAQDSNLGNSKAINIFPHFGFYTATLTLFTHRQREPNCNRGEALFH